ncbi:MAG: hypothetical protein GXP25_10715 [Planctomycetes bacterium]|nr:hypothetical protein [Planctomycetota bacterium]
MVTVSRMTNLRGDRRCEASASAPRCAVCGRSLGMHVRFGAAPREGGLCLSCLTHLEDLAPRPGTQVA